MKKIITCCLLLLIVIACKKQTDTIRQTPVQLRVQNLTPTNFKDVITNGYSYGPVDASVTTNYKSFEQIIDVPNAMLVTTTDTLSAGIFYIDMPSFISTGVYTLQILVDTSTYSGYTCAYK